MSEPDKKKKSKKVDTHPEQHTASSDAIVTIKQRRGRKSQGGKIITVVDVTELSVNSDPMNIATNIPSISPVVALLRKEHEHEDEHEHKHEIKEVDGIPNVLLQLKCRIGDITEDWLKNKAEEMRTKGNHQLSWKDSHELKVEIINDHHRVNEAEIVENYLHKEEQTWNQKLHQIALSMHKNEPLQLGHRCACFWDSIEFETAPVYIPKTFSHGKKTYSCYGNFCSPQCAAAYLFHEQLDTSVKFERYHLLNIVYGKVLAYKQNIRPAPSPHYLLTKFGGSLTIEEYRNILQSDRLILVVDKPMSRSFPEIHEDNVHMMLSQTVVAKGAATRLGLTGTGSAGKKLLHELRNCDSYKS